MNINSILNSRLCCMSFYEFKRIVQLQNIKTIPEDIALISIVDPDWSPDRIEEHLFEDCDNVLNLDFNDIIPELYSGGEILADGSIDDNGEILVPFSETMAERAVSFIEKNLGKRFWIHCAAGISRSQAFIKFIFVNYNAYSEKDTRYDNPCSYPNLDVLHKLNIELLNRIYE